MSSLPKGWESIVEAARLDDDTSLQASFHRLASVAVDVLDGCDHASVTLVRGEEPYTAAQASDIAGRLDDVQYRTGRGPCLDAQRSGRRVLLRHLDRSRGSDAASNGSTADDDVERYPEFADAAVAAGVHSSLSTPLPGASTAGGALNCYSGRTEGFGDDDIERAGMLALVGGVTLANVALLERTRTEVDHLTRALATRDLIGQAKGILMATHRVDVDGAFDLLRIASQRRNVKLADVAAEVTLHGSLDD